MEAPLFEVKNKLSEYVKIAESGEPVQICKHGQPSVIMMSLRDYSTNKNPPVSMFEVFHERWLSKCHGQGLDNSFVDEFLNSIEAARKEPQPKRPNPFEEK